MSLTMDMLSSSTGFIFSDFFFFFARSPLMVSISFAATCVC